jgi:hypothetical protein
LALHSAVNLKSMVTELIGDEASASNRDAKPNHWSRRFAASGKSRPPKPLRMS